MSSDSLVRALFKEVLRNLSAVAVPSSDDEMNERVEVLFTTTTRIAQAPAGNLAEITLKLNLLCRRLRDHLEPDDRGGVLTALLAESIRDDLERLG